MCGCEFGNWGEGFVLVNPIGLHEPLGYQACLVAHNHSIGVPLEPVCPPAPYDVGIYVCVNYDPCALAGEFVKLLLHGLTPVWPVRAAAGLAFVAWLGASWYGY